LLWQKNNFYEKSKAKAEAAKVFLKLVKSARSFKRGFNGLNWLFKSVRNAAFDTNQKDVFHRAENIDDHPDIRAVINFEEQTVNNIALGQALESLDETGRKVLYYKFWEGLTVREIARELGVPRASAQDIVSRALKKLENFFK